MTFQDDTVGLDARVRYVGGGKFDHLLTTLVNNDISSRTYVDLGAHFRVMDRFTLFSDVNNVFNVDPPLSIVRGRCITTLSARSSRWARVKF